MHYLIPVICWDAHNKCMGRDIVEHAGVTFIYVSILRSLLNAWSLMLELLSPRRSSWSKGHWLQLICCALPKRLCP